MSSKSWRTPTWFGECSECGEIFDGGTVAKTNVLLSEHHRISKHTVGWVALCGCGQRFGPGDRAAVAKRLKSHEAQRDYEPLTLSGGDL